MTESICTQCGERFHDGACCCDPSAPPLPTLEEARKQLELFIESYAQGAEWGGTDEDIAPAIDTLIAAVRADLLLRESAQQDKDHGAARGKIAEREQC